MATGISFVKDNTFTMELEFCKVYTLVNQYKMYSKKISVNEIDISGICLYTDLFGNRNILLAIKDY